MGEQNDPATYDPAHFGETEAPVLPVMHRQHAECGVEVIIVEGERFRARLQDRRTAGGPARDHFRGGLDRHHLGAALS